MRSGLRAVVSHDVVEFRAAAGEFLRHSPVQHSVLLTRSAQALAEAPKVRARQVWAWVADGAGEVVGAAMLTPPHGLALSQSGEGAVHALAAALAVERPDLPSVNGPAATTSAFADRWCELTGATSTVHARQGTYRADAIRPPADVPGRARPASVDDVPMLRGWAARFDADTGNLVDGLDHVGPRVEQGLLHLWEDAGTPVSMAAATAAQGGVSRVGLVFTPSTVRGRGYASALVAAVSQQVLDRGAVPMLYTDLDNPVSNAIYQRIGYTPLGEQLVLRLHPGGWAGGG